MGPEGRTRVVDVHDSGMSMESSKELLSSDRKRNGVRPPEGVSAIPVLP